MKPSAGWMAAGLLSVTLLGLPLAAQAVTATIEVKDFAFQPSAVTIAAGDTVTWHNGDTASHTATSTGAWDTGTFAPGASRSITFTTPGTYPYFCLIHSIMFGTIVVLPEGETSTSATRAPTSAVAGSPLPPAPSGGRLVLAAADPPAGVTNARLADQPGVPALTVASWAMFLAGALALAWRLARPR